MRPIIAVPATLALILRARSKDSLTPAGLLAATLTAIAHAYHPWNLPFVLLCVFFLAGTRVTHINQHVKATLTLHAKGSPGGEGPRTHVQVLANSLMASILAVAHGYQLRRREAAYADPGSPNPETSTCFAWAGDLLVVGIIAHYAAVAADTFSSELGILSGSEPRLITSLTLRKVPRGTNGGVTLLGLAAGCLGSMVVVAAAVVFLPLCTGEPRPGDGPAWTLPQRRLFLGGMVVWGTLGSVLDSVLGALFQRSVRDVRSGKIVEGEGGDRVLVTPGSARGRDAADRAPSRAVESGWDLLDNNDVNFLMASTMSIGAMGVAAWYWDVPLESVWRL
ncbi:hypothetical protein E4U42_000317 [Claviceps africana]|uniref:Transmembrane protein 19 n=1 Tax=Claviceps africana TaxID=83212 RepID=A0A8K0JAQ7_9HYPO|nr:hypothetical protein E4U42_000317 [Claviceps africana]